MTEETLKKAQALKREIEDTKRLLGELSVRRMYADKNLAVEKKRKPWLMRALNLSEKMNEPKKATIIIFDNVNPHGTEIWVDEDFLNYVIDYFKNRQAEKEKEFEMLD